MWEKVAPTHIGHVIRRVRSACKRIDSGIL